MPSHRERARKRPDSPPTFFTDRSLGAYTVPIGLLDEGWELEIMADVYGEQLSQALTDPPWIEEATSKGQVILTKDFDSLRKGEELATIKRVGARVFALANAQLPGSVQLQWFVYNQHRIFRACRKRGPFIYKVYDDHIDPWLSPSAGVK